MVYGGFILLGQRPATAFLARSQFLLCLQTGIPCVGSHFLEYCSFFFVIARVCYFTIPTSPDWRAHSQVLTSNQLDQEMHPHIRLVEFPI